MAANVKKILYKPTTCSCEWKVSGIGLSLGNTTNWINGHITVVNELSGGHHWHWYLKLYHKVKPELERHKFKIAQGSIVKLLEIRTGQLGLVIGLKESGTNIRLSNPQNLATLREFKMKLEYIKDHFPPPVPPDIATAKSIIRNSNTMERSPLAVVPNSDLTFSPKRARSVSESSADQQKEDPEGDPTTPQNDENKNRLSSSVPAKQEFIQNALRKSVGALAGSLGTNNFYKQSSSGWGQNMVTASKSTGKIPRKPGLLSLSSRSVDYSWSKLKPTSPFKDQSSSSQLQGFSNLGNTCYMNAILQSLFSLDSFSTDLMNSYKVLEKQASPVQNKGILLRALARLMRANRNGVSPQNKSSLLLAVKQAISSSAKRFLGHEQHDAQEFLCQILDQLKEEIIALNKELKKISEAQEEQKVPPLSPQGSLANPTVENFECEVLHSISCLQCGERVTKPETFNDLSLELPKQTDMFDEKTIQDALNQFFCSEKIEYKCEKCSSQTASVKHELVKLPRVLIIHLKRYAFSSARSLQGKLGRSIQIPHFLTLSHLSHDVKSPSLPCVPAASPSPVAKKEETSYHPSPIRPVSVANQENDPLVLESPPTMLSAFKRRLRMPSPEEEESLPEIRKKARPERRIRPIRRLLEAEQLPSKDDSIPKIMPRQRSFSDYRLDLSEEEQLRMALEMSLEQSDGQSADKSDDIFRQVDGVFDDADLNKDCSLADEHASGDAKASGPAAKDESAKNPSAKGADVAQGKKVITLHCEEENSVEDLLMEGIWASPIKGNGNPSGLIQVTPDKSGGSGGKWSPELKSPGIDAFDRALEESRREHEMDEEKFQDELERVKEMSLLEHLAVSSYGKDLEEEESVKTDEALENDDLQKMIKDNCQSGKMPHSFQLTSVVSHFGSSSMGHYISDIYNIHKKKWFSCDDSSVQEISEDEVYQKRTRTGYIFFYMNKEVLQSIIAARNSAKLNRNSVLSESVNRHISR